MRMRCANLRSRFCQFLDFVFRPWAKSMPQRIIAASEFLSVAADQALGVKVVIAAVELMQFQLERSVVVRTPDRPVLPKQLHDLMRLFR